MRNKKGFLATSMIYSFFLVFLMLMVTILAENVNNRVLVGRIKDDIREEIDGQQSFVTDVLEAKNYLVGDTVSYAGEDWQVIEDKGTQVVLVLKRALTKKEIVDGIGEEGNNALYGSCDDTSCQVRACYNASTLGTAGELYCWIFESNTNLYRIPSWMPNETQIKNQNYGQTIVSAVTRSWFNTHQGLQKALNNNKLINMTFSDGELTTTGYVRIPSTSEVSNATNVSKWYSVKPFHILEKNSNIETRIYNTALENVNSNTAAFIRPVIEVQEG